MSKNKEQVVVLPDETANLNENGFNNEEKEFSEDAFFATGHFSIHHQPSDYNDSFMGE